MAYIAYREKLFHGVGKFEERSIFKNAGFEWSPLRKAWVTPSLDIALRVVGVAWTKSAAEYAQAVLETAETSYEMSWAGDTAFEPPAPPGLAFLPFQKAGVHYAIQRKDTLIGDQPGLGKTIQAIGVSNTLNLRRVLVVAPASLKVNWQREFLKWTTIPGLTVGIAEASYVEKVRDGVYKGGAKAGQPRYRNVTHKDVWPDTDVVVINYDILERFTTQINEGMWDLLVCDEAHALKTDTSKRTLFVLGGMERKPGAKPVFWRAVEARHRVFLSGTPMLNRPIELWPFVRAVDPAGLGKNKRDYEYRYCAGHTTHFGFDNSGASHQEELGAKLRSLFMVRRLKREVLPELPGKRRIVVALDSPEIRELVAREDEIAQALKLYERHVAEAAANDAGGDLSAEEFEAVQGLMITERARALGLDKAFADEDGVPKAHRLNMDYAAAVLGLDPPMVDVLFEEMARVRHDLGVAKLSAAVPWIKDFLDTDEKLVCFAYHVDVVEALAEKLKRYNPAVIYGKVPPRRRQAEVDRFQEDESCRLIDCNIAAGGVGYTMTRSRDVAFVEGDWVPAMMEQCEDRVCRIGQKADGVSSWHLVANGSLDARIAQSAKVKADNIELAMDSKIAA